MQTSDSGSRLDNQADIFVISDIERSVLLLSDEKTSKAFGHSLTKKHLCLICRVPDYCSNRVMMSNVVDISSTSISNTEFCSFFSFYFNLVHCSGRLIFA